MLMKAFILAFLLSVAYAAEDYYGTHQAFINGIIDAHLKKDMPSGQESGYR